MFKVNPAVSGFRRIIAIKADKILAPSHKGLIYEVDFLLPRKFVRFLVPDILDISRGNLGGFKLSRVVSATEQDFLPRRQEYKLGNAYLPFPLFAYAENIYCP